MNIPYKCICSPIYLGRRHQVPSGLRAMVPLPMSEWLLPVMSQTLKPELAYANTREPAWLDKILATNERSPHAMGQYSGE
jgi:hypothetical protein